MVSVEGAWGGNEEEVGFGCGGETVSVCFLRTFRACIFFFRLGRKFENNESCDRKICVCMCGV